MRFFPKILVICYDFGSVGVVSRDSNSCLVLWNVLFFGSPVLVVCVCFFFFSMFTRNLGLGGLDSSMCCLVEILNILSRQSIIDLFALTYT